MLRFTFFILLEGSKMLNMKKIAVIIAFFITQVVNASIEPPKKKIRKNYTLDHQKKPFETLKFFFERKSESELLSVIQNILIQEIDINSLYGENDLSLLHLSCLYGKIKCVNFLLNNHADPNLQTEKTFSTPLHFAMKNFHKDCVESLIKVDAVEEE